MSSQYYYSQSAHTTIPPNSGFQQHGALFAAPSSTTPSSIASHQLPMSSSGHLMSQTTNNIHVIPAHHYQPQIITHQQIIQPQTQSNLSSPMYSPSSTLQTGQHIMTHPSSCQTRTQNNPSLLSASINGTRFLENGTVSQSTSQITQNTIHPQRVQVSPQPIIVSTAGNAFSLENGQHVTVQQTSQPYYTNLPQGTVVQTHVAYSQPTSVAQVPSQAHFHHSVPTIQVVHTNPPPPHAIQHNRIIQAEPRTIYQHTNRGSLHFQREDIKYVPVVTHKCTPQPTFTPIQVPSFTKVDEEKKYHTVTTIQQPIFAQNTLPLGQSNRLSVFAICRENSSQENISPLTPLSSEEFDAPHQPSFSSTFQRMRLDDKNNVEDHSFKPVSSAMMKNVDQFQKQSTTSKLKMTLDSQSLMVEKDESAETMDFNYYPSNSKEGALVADEYDQPACNEGKRSCSECRRVHKRCSKERPCLRCVRLGKKCVDLPEKKRGRPKKIDKVRQMNNTLSTATPSSVSSVSSNSSPSLLKMSLASIGSNSSLSSYGATPISTSSSLSDSLGSSFNSQVSSVSSVGNYLNSPQHQKSEIQPKDTVLPSFSNLIQELDIRDSFSRNYK